MAEVRRLFFALWPDEGTRAGLAEIQRALPSHHGRSIYLEDLHLTLFFLGDVSTERRACVDAAAGGIRACPIALDIDRTGLWPRSRILWCGPSLTPVDLAGLVEKLTVALAGCGFKGEDRPYRAHVTLARKSGLVPTGPLAQPLHWSSDRFVLAASASAAGPPRYRVLREWPLDG